jgi:hypothetical protein
MKAQAILQKMRARYASLDSYRDWGAVINDTCTITFLTHFRRPSYFRFEWNDAYVGRDGRLRTTSSAIWSNEGGAYKCYDWTSGTERVRCLSSAVAGATGISMGAAHNLAVMLMEEIGGFALSDLQRPTLARTEFEGTPCYRIRGQHPHGFPYIVLIGTDDLLVRQVCEPKDNSRNDLEFRRNIRVNEPIEMRVFRGRPRI